MTLFEGAGAGAVFFLEAAVEVCGVGHAYAVAYFLDREVRFAQECGGAFEAHVAQIFHGAHAVEFFQLVVELYTAHLEGFGKCVYVEVVIAEMIADSLLEFGQKQFVVFILVYGNASGAVFLGFGRFFACRFDVFYDKSREHLAAGRVWQGSRRLPSVWP